MNAFPLGRLATFVPPHWTYTTVGTIADPSGGDVQTGPFGSQLHVSDYSENGTPVVMPQDISNGTISTDGITRVDETHVARLARHRVRIDDILFSRRGDVARFAVITEREAGWLCGTGCMRVRLASKDVDARYLYRFLSQSVVRGWLELHAKGITMANLNGKILQALPLAFPPLPEQKRIAAVLDAADALRAKRRAAIAKLESLTQAIFIDMFGDPVHNARRWPVQKFRELGSLDRGISTNRPRNAPEFLGGTYPLVQTGEIVNCDGYVRSYTSTYSEVGLRQSKMWPPGTLCITIAANIAKTGILTFPACFPDSIVGFRAASPATTEYVRVWLSFLQKSLEDNAPESAQKNINLGMLRELEVPCPPGNMREQFAQRLAVTTQLRQIERKAMANLDALFSCLQHQAFRGEL
jgi:type I restriction enzyme, S subunit